MSQTTLFNVNGYLLRQGTYLSTCCCDQFKYWEALPCATRRVAGDACQDDEQCQFNDRHYVLTPVLCAGQETKICECQKLRFKNYTSAVSTANIATVTAQGAWSNVTGIVSPSSLTLVAKRTGPNIVCSSTLLFSSYSTFGTMINSGVGFIQASNGDFPFSGSAFNVDIGSATPQILISGTYTNASAITMASTGSHINMSGQGFLRVGPVLFSSTPATFASNMATAVGLGLSTVAEVGVGGADQDFFFTYTNNYCGSNYDPIVLTNNISYSSTQTSGAVTYTGDSYVVGFGQEVADDYTWIPTGFVKCPYEDSTYVNDAGTESGYLSYTSGVQCCPQKGLKVGPTQIISPRTTYGTSFQYMERTIVLGATGSNAPVSGTSGCFTVNPFFFLFGKVGKFTDDPQRPYSTFVNAGCDYSVSGNCGPVNLPANAEVELFVPFFHKNLPWGPFGSYRRGLENSKHPAYQAQLDYGFYTPNNIPAQQQRLGCYYMPSGQVRAKGSWTDTQEIEVAFRYAKVTPFYMALSADACTSPSGDDYWFGQIDSSTLSTASGFDYVGNYGGRLSSTGNLEGMIWITFQCTGRTVMDFINGINKVKTLATPSGITCNVFSFCAAASGLDLQRIPANKINNLSAELFQCWGDVAPTGGNYPIATLDGVSHPDTDQYLFSGSEIFCPKDFEETFLATDGLTYPLVLDSNLTDCVVRGRTPPPCKRSYALPKVRTTNIATYYGRRSRSFWTSMQGQETTVATVIRNPDSTFDTNVGNLRVAVSGGSFWIKGYAIGDDTTLVASTGLPLTMNGSGYTVSGFLVDLNRATLLKAIVDPPFITGYFPVIGTITTNVPGDVYLDDSTWISGGAPTGYGAGSRTRLNFGYAEPLIPFAETVVSSSSKNLTSWVRRRCNYKVNPTDSAEAVKLAPLNPCVPPHSVRHNSPSKVNCGGDDIIANNRLLTYGCLGSVCKDEFYIQAQRCGCDTMKYCYDAQGYQTVQHPFNRITNNSTTDYASPTLYMCVNNLHPLCDIPFLIKVPYQYAYDGAPPITVPPYPGCASFTGFVVPATTVEYTIPPIVNDYAALNAGYDGWCQYIDPLNQTLVRKSEIPRTYPPQALVMERSTTKLCTTNVNPLDLPLGSSVLGKYDYIGALTPWVPYDYIFAPGTIISCNNNVDVGGYPLPLYDRYGEALYTLYAYVRPIVKNFLAGDVCPFGINTLSRIDIDCNSRCCGCGFICNLADGGADSTGPVRAVSSHTASYDNINQSQIPVACISYVDPASVTPGADCNANLCNYCDCQPPPNGNPCNRCPRVRCVQDDQTSTINATFSADYGIPTLAGVTTLDGTYCIRIDQGASCCFNLTGQSIVIDTINTGGCSGQWASACLADPNNYCNQVDTSTCYHATYQNISCEGIPNPGYPEGTYSYVYQQSGPNCDSPLVSFTMNESGGTVSNTNINACGQGTITWNANDLKIWTFLQDPGAGCPNKTYNNTTARDGSIVFTGPNSEGCNYDTIGTTHTYTYIINLTLGWSCGIPNNSRSTNCLDGEYTY